MIHRVMYPVLGLIILGQSFLVVGSLEDAIRLDHTTQSVIEDKASINALFRFIRANTKCDATPKQLAERMGPPFTETASLEDGTTEVSDRAFRARFEGQQLRAVEVVGIGTVELCK